MIDKQKVLDAIDAEDAVMYRSKFREVVEEILEEVTSVSKIAVKSHDNDNYGQLEMVFFCSSCGSSFPFNQVTKYCPNCGRMVVNHGDDCK